MFVACAHFKQGPSGFDPALVITSVITLRSHRRFTHRSAGIIQTFDVARGLQRVPIYPEAPSTMIKRAFPAQILNLFGPKLRFTHPEVYHRR